MTTYYIERDELWPWLRIHKEKIPGCNDFEAELTDEEYARAMAASQEFFAVQELLKSKERD